MRRLCLVLLVVLVTGCMTAQQRRESAMITCMKYGDYARGSAELAKCSDEVLAHRARGGDAASQGDELGPSLMKVVEALIGAAAVVGAAQAAAAASRPPPPPPPVYCRPMWGGFVCS
jgi:hypothetical protein